MVTRLSSVLGMGIALLMGTTALAGEFGAQKEDASAVGGAEDELLSFKEQLIAGARKGAVEAAQAAQETAKEQKLLPEDEAALVATVVDAAMEPAKTMLELPGTPAAAALYASQADQPRLNGEGISAINLLSEYAQTKGFVTSWDAKQQRIFIIQTSSFNTEDPAADKDFAVRREVAARQATLLAKADIIRYIAAKISAGERYEVPGTDIEEQLNAQYRLAQARMAEHCRSLAKLMVALDKAQAEELEGVGYGDRTAALFDAAIKHIDKAYSKDKVAKDKLDRLREIERRYNEGREELARIEAETEQLRRKPIDTTASDITVFSSMPLLGSVVAQTAESWNKTRRQYEVAVLMCWSPALEKAARAALVGEVPIPEQVGQKALKDWLRSQDAGALVGSRQFLDPLGNRHFLGIAARPVVDNSGQNRINRREADAFAMSQALFCLFSDVETFLEAQQQADTMNVDAKTSRLDVTSSLSERIGQRVKDLQVHGLAPIHQATATHPLTGQELHVAVYAISPASAAQAMAAQQEAMLSSIRMYDIQNYLRGRQAGLDQAVDAARNNAASFERGRRDGRSAVDAANTPAQTLKMEKPAATPAVVSPSVPSAAPAAAPVVVESTVQAAKEGAVIAGDVDVP